MTSARERPAVENPDYAKFAIRILRAMARRAGGDIEFLPVLRDLPGLVDELMHDAIAACRADGYSWAEIAERLGTSRQAAQQRYGAAEDAAAIRCQDRIDVHRAG